MAVMSMGWLAADWPAPSNVRAGTTLREGGVSQGAFASFNLGAHVGDAPAAVAENRRRLVTELGLPREPQWLNQVHGVAVLEAPAAASVCADAVVAHLPQQVCAVLTADCLPVLFCDTAGERIAAAHAGWRGLAAGVLEATLDRLAVPADQVLAWLGPAIGPAHFEVGDEVRAAFLAHHGEAAAAFRPARRPGHWYADLYALARLRLQARNVTCIYGGNHCTYDEAEQFYSYRRDGGTTGRMASLVWRLDEAIKRD